MIRESRQGEASQPGSQATRQPGREGGREEGRCVCVGTGGWGLRRKLSVMTSLTAEVSDKGSRWVLDGSKVTHRCTSKTARGISAAHQGDFYPPCSLVDIFTAWRCTTGMWLLARAHRPSFTKRASWFMSAPLRGKLQQHLRRWPSLHSYPSEPLSSSDITLTLIEGFNHIQWLAETIPLYLPKSHSWTNLKQS